MPVANDDTGAKDENHDDNMDDIVKALTSFSVHGEENSGDDLEESDDIIQALTDFSAVSDVEPSSTTSLDNDTLPPATTATDQNNVVTISYTQVCNVCVFPSYFIICQYLQSSSTGSPDSADDKLQPQKVFYYL